MATLADELLNDFEDSGSDNGAEAQDGDELLGQSDVPSTNGVKSRPSEADMNMDEDDGDRDEITMNGDALKDLEDEGDEEEAKAKVERMQFGGVSDVRSVAGLMKTLDPVLQVGTLLTSRLSSFLLKAQGLHHSSSSSLISCVYPENRPLPVSAAREANDPRRLDRGQPRIPSPHAVKHALHVDLQRNHPRPQVHSRPLLGPIPRARHLDHWPTRLCKGRSYHWKWPHG